MRMDITISISIKGMEISTIMYRLERGKRGKLQNRILCIEFSCLFLV